MNMYVSELLRLVMAQRKQRGFAIGSKILLSLSANSVECKYYENFGPQRYKMFYIIISPQYMFIYIFLSGLYKLSFASF